MCRVTTVTEYVFAIVCTTLIVGCVTQPKEPPISDHFMKGALELDRVSRNMEQLGTISVSTPIIVKPSSKFSFDLNRTAGEYYSESRLEGASEQREFKALDIQVALSANIEEVAKALKAMQGSSTPSKLDTLKKAMFSFDTAQQALATTSGLVPSQGLTPQQQGLIAIGRDVLDRAAKIEASAPAPTDPTYKSPDMPSFLTKDQRTALSTLPASFTSALPQLSDTASTGLSPGEKISLASSDKMKQDILSWFAFPQTADLGDNKLVYLCLLMVSCHPGYLTQEGFASEVTVAVDYGREENGEMRPARTLDRRRPFVAAAYPMFDAQMLDLRSTLRNQFSFASQLAASGFGFASKAMLDYAKRLERDVQTKTLVTVGSAVSYGGGTFGYRVEPRLVALANPARRKSQPAMKMDSVTFPALVILVCDKEDVDSKFGGSNDKGYKYVVFNSEYRWLPVAEIGKGTLGAARAMESERLDYARALDKAFDSLGRGTAQSGHGSYEYQALSARHAMLADMLGPQVFEALPKPKSPEEKVSTSPEVKSVSPLNGWANRPSLFLISGANLSKRVGEVSIGGVPCEIVDVRDGSLAALLKEWPSGRKDNLNQPVIVSTDTGVFEAGKVNLVNVEEAKKPGPKAASAAVEVQRDPAGNITKLQLSGPVHEDAMAVLKQLNEILQSGQSGSFSMDFEGHGGVKAESKR